MDIKVVKVHKSTKVDLVGAAGHVEGATGATDVSLVTWRRQFARSIRRLAQGGRDDRRIVVGAQSSRDIGSGKVEEDTRANCDSDL